MVNESEVTMNSAAAHPVIFVRRLAAARGPKAVCDPWPPKVPARSALLPCCSRTTPMRKKQTMMWTTTTAISKKFILLLLSWASFAELPVQNLVWGAHNGKIFGAEEGT